MQFPTLWGLWTLFMGILVLEDPGAVTALLWDLERVKVGVAP